MRRSAALIERLFTPPGAAGSGASVATFCVTPPGGAECGSSFSGLSPFTLGGRLSRGLRPTAKRRFSCCATYNSSPRVTTSASCPWGEWLGQRRKRVRSVRASWRRRFLARAAKRARQAANATRYAGGTTKPRRASLRARGASSRKGSENTVAASRRAGRTRGACRCLRTGRPGGRSCSSRFAL